MPRDVFEDPLTAAAGERLADVARVASRTDTEALFGDFLREGSRSDAEFTAAFLAAQMLRGIGIISRREAAYVEHRLICQARPDCRPTDDAVRTLYRWHGEDVTVTMIEQDLPTYERNVDGGRLHLIAGKPAGGAAEMIRSGDALAAITARAIALAEHASRKDRALEWQRLVKILKRVSVLAAVRSVSSLRQSGVLSAGQAARLIDRSIRGPMVRLCRRSPTLRPHLPVLKQGRHRELARQLKVGCLRRLGEYGMARLLSTAPNAYYSLLRDKPPLGPRFPIKLEQELEKVLQLMQLPIGGTCQRSKHFA